MSRQISRSRSRLLRLEGDVETKLRDLDLDLVFWIVETKILKLLRFSRLSRSVFFFVETNRDPQAQGNYIRIRFVSICVPGNLSELVIDRNLNLSRNRKYRNFGLSEPKPKPKPKVEAYRNRNRNRNYANLSVVVRIAVNR